MLKKIVVIILDFFKSGGKRTQKLKRNVLGSFIIKCISVLIELIKVPILLSYLGTEKYGVWLTIVSIVMWLQNFDLGLGTGLRYKFTESLALKDNVRGKHLISTAYFSMGFIMSVIFIISIPIIYLLDWNNVLNVNSIPNAELSTTVLLVAFIFLSQFALSLISVVLKADQRAAISDAFKPISSVVSLILILIISKFSSSSLFLAGVTLALPQTLILIFANIYFFIKDYKEYIPKWKFFDKYYLKDIYSLGLKYFIGQLSGLVVFSSANIMLANLVNPQEVSVYNTAYTYFSLIIVFNTIILVPFSAAITDAYVQNDYVWIKRIMKKLNLTAVFFSIAAIIMLLISKFVFKIWIGDRISIPIGLSIILSVYSIMNVFVSPYNIFLGGVGKLNLNLIISLCKIVLFIPVAIFLIKVLGTIGLVITIIIINTLPNFVFGSYQYKKIINRTATGLWDR